MVRSLLIAIAVATLIPAWAAPAEAGVVLDPVESPDWQVDRWLNENPGKLRGLRDKVVVIEFFQLWCPGCKHFSLPLFADWFERYEEADNVVVLSIHTVFEGHDVQTPERLEAFVKELGIRRPVGIDSQVRTDDDVRPITMQRFKTGGTPHVVIVDKKGLIRFSHFGYFERGPVENLIERLRKETD